MLTPTVRAWGLCALLFLAVAFCFHARPAFALPDAGSGSGHTPIVVTGPDGEITVDVREMQRQYRELRAAYDAAKDVQDRSLRMALYAGLLATLLKFALDAVKAIGSFALRRAMSWVALLLAVPIALFTRFAAGGSWLDALIFAAAGPGAVVVHELINAVKKRPTVTSTPGHVEGRR